MKADESAHRSPKPRRDFCSLEFRQIADYFRNDALARSSPQKSD
jgi:hypothetical protein